MGRLESNLDFRGGQLVQDKPIRGDLSQLSMGVHVVDWLIFLAGSTRHLPCKEVSLVAGERGPGFAVAIGLGDPRLD